MKWFFISFLIESDLFKKNEIKEVDFRLILIVP
jgi:hypothetical protein